MAPCEVPKFRITVEYVDPATREVVEVVHYPAEKDETK
jgi:hypothetical protein